MKRKNLIIPWLSLSCILVGMLLGFNSAFECGIYIEKHLLSICSISGVVVFLVLYLRTNYAVIFTLSAIAGMGLFALTRIEWLQGDFQSVIYFINQKSIEYNDKVFTPFEGIRGDMDENLFLFMIGALFAVFIAFFVFQLRNCWYGMLPVYAVFCIDMAVGKTPDKASIVFLIAGISLAMAWVSRQEHGGRRFFAYRRTKRQRPAWTYAILCVVLSAGLVSAWQYGNRTEEFVLKDANQYLLRQHELERRVKRSAEDIVQYIRAQTGLDSDGNLSNSEPRYTNKAVMTLTSTRQPKASLYLRGFVGGTYENGKWKECDTKSFQKIMSTEEEVEGVLNVGYSTFENSINLAYIPSKNRIKIEHTGIGKNSKFAYLPYFSDSASVSNDTSQKCITLDGENGIRKKQNEYSVNCFDIAERDLQATGFYWAIGEDVMKQIMQQERMKVEGISPGWDMPDQKVGQYFDYVREKYIGIPGTGLTKLKRLAKSIPVYRDADLTEETAETVRRILAQQAVYDKKLEPVPDGKDYVEYFLFEQQKGFCEHFATAGTLMLRARNVPARYAAGYKVTPDRFKKNEDGTYTATVLDSDAHAWTEVFNACYGWYPEEMTPGEGANSRRQDTASNPEKTIAPVMQGQKEDEVKKPKETVTLTPVPTNHPQDNGRGKGGQVFQRGNPVFPVLAAIILIVLMLTSYVAYQHHLQKKYREEMRKQKEDINAAIRIRTELFLYLLRKCGKRKLLQKNEAEWFVSLAEEYKEVEEVVWQQLKAILQEAEFSNESVSIEKYNFFFDAVAKAEKLIVSKLSWGKRGFLRIIGFSE